tara:strand:- start:406 stop:678 length:273 start_codon:yes stop_codon:yes gene_type:complete
MKLPTISNEYRPSIQTELQTQLEKANDQNLKLDQDNFLTTGSICLQSANGKWWQVTISDGGTLGVSELTTTDGRLDSEGRPLIASSNPYV